jgi:hypothetical protein
MFALRYAYVLLLALWIGGMVTLGALVAPATFQVLDTHDAVQGRVLAAALFGEVLRRFYLFSYIAGVLLLACLAAMALLGPRPTNFAIRVALVGGMLAISLASGLGLAGRIDRIQQQTDGPVRALPADDARRVAFERLHGMSTFLMLVTLAGGLVLLHWEARER